MGLLPQVMGLDGQMITVNPFIFKTFREGIVAEICQKVVICYRTLLTKMSEVGRVQTCFVKWISLKPLDQDMFPADGLAYSLCIQGYDRFSDAGMLLGVMIVRTPGKMFRQANATRHS